MSLLINDSLIWVATPKCASIAIENALYSSNLNIKPYTHLVSGRHSHVPLDFLKRDFGNKESICITRDWFEKWVSALSHLWDVLENKTPFELTRKWEDIDNTFIYSLFDTEFLNYLHSVNDNGFTQCLSKLIVNTEDLNARENYVGWVSALISEKYYKSNSKCTYEFDIKDIDKFVAFIEERFGVRLIIENVNVSKKRESRLILNEELKQFVWDKFEKRFEKTNRLL